MKILLIADEKTFVERLVRGLRRKGLTVEAKTSSEETLQHVLLLHDEYDLIVMDSPLTHTNEEEFRKTIKTRGIQIPIISLIENDETDPKKLAFHSNGTLMKPFSLTELTAKIETTMQRASKDSPEVLAHHAIELDVVHHTVRRGKRELHLTLTEFTLLEHLMRNSERVLQRDELLHVLFGFDLASFHSNVLDVHIKNLRKKIDISNRPSMIQSVRGVGYKLRD